MPDFHWTELIEWHLKCWTSQLISRYWCGNVGRKSAGDKSQRKKIVHTESQTFVSSLILLLKKKAADKTKIQKKIEVLAGASGAEQQVSEE